VTKPGEYVWYIEDMHLEGTGPINLVQEASTIPDLGLDMSWAVSRGCAVQPETQAPRQGTGAARLTMELGPRQDAGGRARIRSLDGQPWPATGISFWCRAETAPYLDVTAQDSDGTTVVWYLRQQDLTVGEWREVRLSADNLLNVGPGDNTMNDIAMLTFDCYARYDPQRTALPREGAVTWVLDDFALADHGPVPVRRMAAAVEGVADDTGDSLSWSAWGRAVVENDLAIVRDGAKSLRLTLKPERTGLRGGGAVVARLPEPRAADALLLWLWPRAPGPFQVTATDTQKRTARWTLPLEQLAPEKWNQLVLFLRDARVADAKGIIVAQQEFGPIAELSFGLSAVTEDPQQESAWYVDSVQLVSEEAAP